MKLKKYKKRKYITTGILIIITSIFISLYLINYYAKKANYYLITTGELQVKKILTQIVNNCMSNLEFDNNLYEIKKDNDNKIEMINYKSYEMTLFINKLTNIIENNIYQFENNKSSYQGYNNGIIARVPVLSLFSNSFLAQVGPKVGIKMDFLGTTQTKLETEVKPYGINNSYIEVRIKVNLSGRIIMPFVSREINIENVYPISMSVISGTVPNGFISSFN